MAKHVSNTNILCSQEGRHVQDSPWQESKEIGEDNWSSQILEKFSAHLLFAIGGLGKFYKWYFADNEMIAPQPT